jgi:hypothetical protein
MTSNNFPRLIDTPHSSKFSKAAHFVDILPHTFIFLPSNLSISNIHASPILTDSIDPAVSITVSSPEISYVKYAICGPSNCNKLDLYSSHQETSNST